MKRFISALIAFTILFTLFPALAEPNDTVGISKAASALLMDADSGKVIMEKDSGKKTEAAGLKRLPALLTVCRAFDSGELTEETVVTVCDEAAKIKGPTAFISANERILAGQLLKAAVILTAGDAIYALLRSVYKSETASLEAVNNVLKEEGLDPLAGDSIGNGTFFSANDVARISFSLSKSGAFLKYSSVYLDTVTHENAKPTELTNPNRLVRFYTGCFGVATGSVGSSEYAGAFIARRGSTCFLAVILGMPDSGSRFSLATNMLDYGFSMFRSVNIGKNCDDLGSVPVIGGKERSVEVGADGVMNVLMPIGDTKIKTEVILPEEIEAPVEKGAVIGTFKIFNSSGELIGEVPITAKNTVEKAVFGDYFILMLLSWLRIRS
ncbi:MAG: hypothetical protein K6F68_00230 [Clostridiales bacterium]|nr:hypothetical protein [Clostridiales bacterium]